MATASRFPGVADGDGEGERPRLVELSPEDAGAHQSGRSPRRRRGQSGGRPYAWGTRRRPFRVQGNVDGTASVVDRRD